MTNRDDMPNRYGFAATVHHNWYHAELLYRVYR